MKASGVRPLRLAVRAAAAMLALGAVGWAVVRFAPLPDGLTRGGNPGFEWQDVAGRPLRVSANGPGRAPAPVAEAAAPPAVILATLAAEDARFWRHPGVDWRATARAMMQAVLRGRIVSGGSTITQQLIKLAQPRRRVWGAKAAEAIQALRLEQVWDKERILSEYLRRLDYGDRSEGLADAARRYFGKPPADLSLAEAALLAGLPQAPSRLNPRRHPERAKARQEWILRRCAKLGWIAPDEAARAISEPVRLAPAGRPFCAPHFVDFARARLGRSTAPGPLRTTLDVDIQADCEEALRRGLAPLRARRMDNGAVVVLDNRTGGVLAMVGSADWYEPAAGQVNGALAPRSPGSALKPFAYLLAFQDGASAGDVVGDVPVEFAGASGIFRPVNYSRRCSGPVRLREALACSLNIPAVRVLDAHGGAPALCAALRACGVTTLERPASDYGLGLVLGGGEVRLLELANAYAALARLGEWKPVQFLASDAARAPAGRRVFDAGACWLVLDILADPSARAAAFGLDSALRFDFPVSCKTGTSSDFRDNWAFAVTPEFTVGVWTGNFGGRPTEAVSGVEGAAPVMHEIVERLNARRGCSSRPAPPDAVWAQIHPLTGRRLRGLTGERGVREVFLAGRAPADEQPRDYDDAGRVRLSAEYDEWLRGPDNRLQGLVVGGGADSGPFRILTPPPGAVFLLDGDLPAGAQSARLRASAECDWRCETLEVTGRGGEALVRLAPGAHRVTATRRDSGERAEVLLEVRRL